MEQQVWLMRLNPRSRFETAEMLRTSQGSLVRVFAFKAKSGNSTRFSGPCADFHMRPRPALYITYLQHGGRSSNRFLHSRI